MTYKTKSASSKRWLREHETDHYVKKAHAEGYRSRSAYKLLELNAKDKFIRPGALVVDLGAAPGGWTQVAAKLVGDQGRVVASDILNMDSVPRTHFVRGDFNDPAVMQAVIAALEGDRADLVLCDLAPNMSGVRQVDQARHMNLAEQALYFAEQTLKSGGVKFGGDFLVKLFHGEGFDAYLKALREKFATVKVRKPQASRDRSHETYVLARGYNGCVYTDTK